MRLYRPDFGITAWLKQVSWRDIAFEIEVSLRLGSGFKWFAWEGTWREHQRYKTHQPLVWCRFILTVLGLRMGAGFFVGKKVVDTPPKP